MYIRSNVPDRVLPAAVEVPCALKTPSLATTLPLSSVDRSTMFYRDFLRWLRRKSLCLSTIQPVPQELGIAPSRTFNEDAWISTHRICPVVRRAVVAAADHRLALNGDPARCRSVPKTVPPG